MGFFLCEQAGYASCIRSGMKNLGFGSSTARSNYVVDESSYKPQLELAHLQSLSTYS